MKWPLRRTSRLAQHLGIVLSIMLLYSSASQAQNDIVVIAHHNVEAQDLSTSKLKSIFGMRTRTWSDGQAIKVFVLADSNPMHIGFSKIILNTYPYNLRRIWDRRVYSGTGLAPKTVNNEKEMLALIATTPNAIGYIYAGNVDINVKILRIR